jgi:hypothetical protein
MQYKVTFIGSGERCIRPNVTVANNAGIVKALRDAQCLPSGKFDVTERNGLVFVSKGEKALFELTKIS